MPNISTPRPDDRWSRPRRYALAVRPSIAVVVPMLNAADDLEPLITSLLKQEFDQPWEIVAVDNCSDDDSANIARALLREPLPKNLVKSQVIEASPRGYATPRNAGVQASEAPLLAFCDADGAVDEGWLKAIASSLVENRLVASRKFRADDVRIRNEERAWAEQRELFTILDVEFVATAGLGCTRELFDALNGFDPSFNNGGEDADFSFRARFQLGVIPVIEQSAVYWTKVPTKRTKSFSKGYRDVRTEVRLYQRHHGQDLQSPLGPFAIVRTLYRVVLRASRLRHFTTQNQNQFTSEVGCLVARAVWSVNYWFSYFGFGAKKRNPATSGQSRT